MFKHDNSHYFAKKNDLFNDLLMKQVKYLNYYSLNKYYVYKLYFTQN
jgi:hypothetical protein